MAVRWPDGSYTGSVRVGKNPPASITVAGPEPETKESSETKKESSIGNR